MFINLKQFNEVLDIIHSMDAVIKNYDNEMHIICKCVISKISLIELFYKMVLEICPIAIVVITIIHVYVIFKLLTKESLHYIMLYLITCVY